MSKWSAIALMVFVVSFFTFLVLTIREAEITKRTAFENGYERRDTYNVAHDDGWIKVE